MDDVAASSFSWGMTNSFDGKMKVFWSFARTFPVVMSHREMDSMVSPQNSMRVNSSF